MKSTPSATRRSEVVVRVQDATRAAHTPSAARFREWVRAAAQGRTEVTIRLVGAAEGRRLNRAYRGRDYATNVLTFDYGRGTGDIVMCPSVVAREAREQGKPIASHYAHLTVHAMLHLRGYDHARKAQAERMERVEVRILRQFGIANPYLA